MSMLTRKTMQLFCNVEHFFKFHTFPFLFRACWDWNLVIGLEAKRKVDSEVSGQSLSGKSSTGSWEKAGLINLHQWGLDPGLLLLLKKAFENLGIQYPELDLSLPTESHSSPIKPHTNSRHPARLVIQFALHFSPFIDLNSATMVDKGFVRVFQLRHGNV